MSAFTILFDLDLSLPKLRVTVFNQIPSLQEAITVHTTGWTPLIIPVKTTGTFKLLGITFDISGPQVTQPALTKLRLSCACTIMLNQRAVDSTLLTATISTMARASYTATQTPWSAADLLALDVPVNQLVRRLTRNPRTYPTHLLHLPAALGGLGVTPLSDLIIHRKWTTMLRLTLDGDRPALAMHGMMLRAARRSGGEAHPALGGYIAPPLGPPVWGSPLGSHSFHRPLRPHHGTFHSVLDEPLTSLTPDDQGK